MVICVYILYTFSPDKFVLDGIAVLCGSLVGNIIEESLCLFCLVILSLIVLRDSGALSWKKSSDN